MQKVLLKSIVLSCGIQLTAVPWLYERTSELYYDSLCNYSPALGSWTICIDDSYKDAQNATLDERSLGYVVGRINRACETTRFTTAQFHDVWANASHHVAATDGTIAWDPSIKVTSPVSLDRSEREVRLAGIRAYYENIAASDSAAFYLFWYMAIILSIGLLTGVSCIRKRILNCVWLSRVRSRMTLPAVSEKHAQDSRILHGLIPTRLELGLVLGYLVVHTIAMSINYRTDELASMEKLYMQKLRAVGDRLGILSFAQLPLIVLFSGRNSFVETISGMRYTTSIVFHKWISRVMLVDAIMHAALYLVHARRGGTYEQTKVMRFWITGVYATWLGILLVVTSIGWLRRNHYELFLVMHIIFAALFFKYSWDHVYEFGWTWWIWSSVALWGLEKCARLIRIRQSGGIVSAQAEIIAADVVRLTIPKCGTAANRTWLPGQYAFLYIVLPKVFWQSHPFTVIDLGDKLQIVVKTKTGATNHLLRYLKETGNAFVRVMVEGPYGSSSTLSNYDSQLLLCGGSGIPGPLAYVLQNECPERIRLVVVCQNTHLLEAFKPQITDAMKRAQVQIYITRQQVYASTGEPPLPSYSGRPDLRVLVETAASCSNSLAVMTCGPPIFVDEARGIVANCLREHPERVIDYIEEYQIW